MGKLGAHELNFSSDIDLVVFFDPRGAGDRRSARGDRAVRAADPPSGPHPAGPHRATAMSSAPTCGCGPIPARRRWRSPVEAALHYYEGRGQNWERAAMIKARPVAGDIAAGEAFLKELQPYRLAQIPGLRGDRRRPLDQAPDPCPQGARRDRRQGPQRQARPRRHPRDRVLRPDPATDRRRPLPGTARPRDGADARPAGRARLDHGRGARRADRGILVPARCRAPHPDGARRADAHAAGRRRGAGAHRPHAGLRRRRRLLRARFRASLQEVERHYAALFETRRSCRPASAISSSPAMSTIPTRCRRCASSASSGRATSAASSAAGISAAIAPPSRPRRASG